MHLFVDLYGGALASIWGHCLDCSAYFALIGMFSACDIFLCSRSTRCLYNWETTFLQDEHEFRKMFFETNAKYVVASYEAAREKTMNTSLQKVLKEVTEERDRVQRFMNILMESLVRVNKENSQLESKVHGLVEEEKVRRLKLSSMQSFPCCTPI